jgi:hypothetical protein
MSHRLVYPQGPKHHRCYSQLPGYPNWGREVRELVIAQCPRVNATLSIESLQDTCEHATRFQSASRMTPLLQRAPLSSATPHGPCCMALCLNVNKRKATRRTKFLPRRPSPIVSTLSEFPPHWDVTSLHSLRFVAMACIGPAGLDLV